LREERIILAEILLEQMSFPQAHVMYPESWVSWIEGENGYWDKIIHDMT
jgi:hypothetical protein